MHRFRRLELGAVDVLYPHLDLGSIFELRLRHLESHGDHAIRGFMRRDFILDRKTGIVLLSEKAIVIEQLLEIRFRDEVAIELLAAGLDGGDLHHSHDERHVGGIGEAKIEHGCAVVIVDSPGSDLQNLALELEVVAFGLAKNEKEHDRYGDYR